MNSTVLGFKSGSSLVHIMGLVSSLDFLKPENKRYKCERTHRFTFSLGTNNNIKTSNENTIFFISFIWILTVFKEA
jgi:hypothetical protein